MKSTPNFRSAAFLREHILHTMAFYEGRCLDPTGGFFHFFKDDGTVYDAHTRHLVSSTRFVFTHAMAARHFPEQANASAWRDAAAHGLRFLREAHRDPATGGYAWQLSWSQGRKQVLDATNHCYGLAFVLLAHAHAWMAGVQEARAGIGETFDLMEKRFWEAGPRLYADEADAQWNVLPYRGQNANMHACEALLAAYEATGDLHYLQRAATLAESVTQRLAAFADGFIWEHYRLDGSGQWAPDWDYNRHDKTNIFRPWGFQPGHFTEWSKLLLTLDRFSRDKAAAALPELAAAAADDQLVHRARALFSAALPRAWDKKHGGMVYGIAPGDLSVCDGDKYFWVQAESIATAAVLGERTGEGGYWDWYDRLWAYSWKHFVDHRHGAWYRILRNDNSKIDEHKSPAGKTDYHTMGACYEVLAALER
jgi:mannose/cellobiose epimerase-like protein (N-acyl-D-glucosamine 2-epimerase family)